MFERDDQSVLEALARDIRDSADGYREATGIIGEESPLQSILTDRLAAREHMCAEIETRLKSLSQGTEPPVEGTLRGELHQQFMHIRTLFQSDEAAALAEIQSAEDYLSNHLREALGKPLSLETYALLTDILTKVDGSRDTMAGLAASA